MKNTSLALAIALALGTSAVANAASPVSGSALLNVLDFDRDGTLSVAELTYAPITLSALDLDGDGIVTAAEMEAPTRSRNAVQAVSTVSRPIAYLPVADFNLLHQIDANGDGVLQSLEIANARSSLQHLDTDKDGMLSRSELRP